MTNIPFKRRIRISCDPDTPLAWWNTWIQDKETGELIKNVSEVTIHIKPGHLNEAKVTYLEVDDSTGIPVTAEGKPVYRTAMVENPTVDIHAYELRYAHDIQEIIEEALTIDGSHHKQWYLWQLADLLGFHLDIDADKGIAP